MRNVFTALILGAICFAMLSSSCTSPTDVRANRVEKKETDQTDNTYIRELNISVSEISFLDIPFESSQAKYFVISNNTAKSVTINKIDFLNNPDKFSINYIQLPIVLAPKGKDSSSREVFITFTARGIGEFVDTMIINDKLENIVKLYASVPAVGVMDVDFGFHKIMTSKVKPPLYVYNNSDVDAVITDFKLIDPEGVFEFLSKLPITIPPGAKQGLIMRFTPKDDKPYNGRIEFKIDGVHDYIDNAAEINGSGID